MSELTTLTRCRLCKKRFAAPAHQIADVHTRTLNYLKQLAQHLIDKHPPENNAAQLQSLEYMALLRLQHFDTEDEAIQTQLDYLRWRIHRATLPVVVPDDKLQNQVQELARHIAQRVNQTNCDDVPELAAVINRELYPIFEAMRNLYEEPGKFQTSQVLNPEGQSMGADPASLRPS